MQNRYRVTFRIECTIDSFKNYSYKGSYAQRPTEEVWEVVTAIHTYIYNKTTIREAHREQEDILAILWFVGISNYVVIIIGYITQMKCTICSFIHVSGFVKVIIFS